LLRDGIDEALGGGSAQPQGRRRGPSAAAKLGFRALVAAL
jgi:hypothetical protein